MKKIIPLILSVLFTFSANAAEGPQKTISGTITSDPKLFKNGNYESYNFWVETSTGEKYSATVHTAWNKERVGEFKNKKGDVVTLTGKYTAPKQATGKYRGLLDVDVTSDFKARMARLERAEKEMGAKVAANNQAAAEREARAAAQRSTPANQTMIDRLMNFSSPKEFWQLLPEWEKCQREQLCNMESAMEKTQKICNDPKYKSDCSRMAHYFITKSRQSQAKIMLSSAYVGQVAYRAEYDKFTSSLKEAEAYRPQHPDRYIIALQSNCPGANPQQTSLDLGATLDPAVAPYKEKLLQELKSVKTNSPCDLKDSFVIVAAGIVDDIAHTIDVWSLNNKKEMLSVKNGLAPTPF
jgi:hypothetical protein